ncbi:hypothetical protein GCM10027569_80580 [Flindersiella endophytica]
MKLGRVCGYGSVLLTFLSALLLGAPDSVLVLAVVLAVSLERAERGTELRRRVPALVVLPAVAVAAAGIGLLLDRLPGFGDVVFTIALAATVWIRRFGPRFTKLGTWAALPLLAVLISPLPPRGAADVGWAALVAVLAFCWVSAVQLVARSTPTAAPVRRVSALRPRPSTRMAIQLAVAVGGAFLIGRLAFGEHWTWIVLTAFVVCSGNRGRTDVVRKGLLRLAGAAAGTVLATFLAGLFGPLDSRSIVAIFVVLAIASGLRTFSYAFWAGGVTAMLALLYGYYGQAGADLLATRLLAIGLGAVLAIGVSWFLLPVRGRKPVPDQAQQPGELVVATAGERDAVGQGQQVAEAEVGPDGAVALGAVEQGGGGLAHGVVPAGEQLGAPAVRNRQGELALGRDVADEQA